MSKKNKGGNNKPQRQSFFQQQEQRLGPGFLNRMNTEEIRKNALRIFKDLADGIVRPEDVENYFNQTDFVYNLLMAAQDNYNYRIYIWQGLSGNPAIQHDTDMQRVSIEVYEQANTYMAIMSHLNNILNNITMYNGVYTRFCLQQLIADIRWKKNAFNGFFVTLPKEGDNRRLRQERRQISNHEKGFRNKDEGGFFNKPPKNNL